MQESLAQTRSDNASSTATLGSKIPSGAGKDSDPKTKSAEASKEAKRHYKSGVKFGRAGSFEQAAASFLEAIRLKPDFGDAYFGLGHAYFDLKRWQESIKALERAVEIDPKDVEAYAMMGQAYSNLRRDSEASGRASNHAPVAERARIVSVAAKSSNASPAESNERILTTIYRVGPSDVLDVRLQNAPTDQQTLYTVSATGLLDHPMLSKPIKVSGLTAEEISELIESDLKSRSVSENPEVLVGVREYSSHTVLVSGLVKDPGTKILQREAIPLYVVLADAQPLPDAGQATVKSQQTSKTITVELADSSAMELLVRSGDVITVQPAAKQFFYVAGDVKAPGEKLFRHGMTLTQAILSAGGDEKDSEVELTREDSGALLVSAKYKLKDIYAGNVADPQILPGDRITVKD